MTGTSITSFAAYLGTDVEPVRSNPERRIAEDRSQPATDGS